MEAISCRRLWKNVFRRFASFRIPRTMLTTFNSPQEKKPVDGSDNLCYIPAKQARIPQDTKSDTSMQISLPSQADQSF